MFILDFRKYYILDYALSVYIYLIMESFSYKGMNSSGDIIESSVSAKTKTEAIQNLIDQGVSVISIKKKKAVKNSMNMSLSQKDKISFFIHIGEMDKAGMKTITSLNLLVDLADSKKLIVLGKKLREKVQEGMHLSDAMKYVGCFGDMFANLIFVAEKTNSLNKVCNMIVEYIKWTENMGRNVKTAIIKPMFSIAFILMMVVGMSIYVLPRLLDVLNEFNGGKLPGYTMTFVTFANLVRTRWFVLPITIMLIYSINKVPRILKMKKTIIYIDKYKLRVPIFGKLLLKMDMARLAAFISILICSGYKANEAIKMSPRVIMNHYIKKSIEDVEKIITNGATLHTAFSKFSVFPKFFVSMIGIGESVNDIEGTIVNIKESYDKEVAVTVDFVISSVKPIIVVLTGVIIGWMGMAVFGPMYASIGNLSTGLK